MVDLKKEVEDVENALKVTVKDALAAFQKEVVSIVQMAQENLKTAVADSKLEIANLIEMMPTPEPVEMTEMFPRWIQHVMHYPGDEAAEKMLNEFAAAEDKEHERRQAVKKKLGRA